MIPVTDLKAASDELRDELDAAYRRVMDSGWYILGEEVELFEAEYAQYCGAAHCVGVGNCLDALHLALLALDIGPGDEVIVPSNTYIATWLAVTHVGAKIVPAEPDIGTYNLDPARIGPAISRRTKAIIPVNLYGQPVDYDAILEVARANNLRVVVDNAQAQGACYRGRPVGGMADIECHSFYPTKNLGAFGDAGAITTQDDELADRVRVLRNYGSRVRYENEVCGYNSRLDTLQAAFLRVKLQHLDEWNDRRRRLAEAYSGRLGQVNDLTLPAVPAWANPVWHLFVVRHPHRDAFCRRLAAEGISTQIHYPVPPHMSGAYKQLEIGSDELPLAREIAASVVSLPLYPQMSLSQINRVAEVLVSIAL